MVSDDGSVVDSSFVCAAGVVVVGGAVGCCLGAVVLSGCRLRLAYVSDGDLR